MRLRPFVVTWDTTEQAEFSAHGQRSLMMVKVAGCKIDLLAGCQIAGEYRLRQTPDGLQTLDVRSKSELGARLPFAFAELGGRLERGASLSLKYFVRGVSYATAPAVYRSDLKQGCEEATHFVLNYAAGAYELSERTQEGAGASAAVGGLGANAAAERSSQALLRGGSFSDCSAAGASCAAPVRLRLLPITEAPAGIPPEIRQLAVQRPAPGTEARTTLSPGQVAAVMRSVRPAALACQQEYRKAGGAVMMKATFTIGADGVVTAVQVDAPNIDANLTRCVEEALHSARFPPAKDPTTVRYPFSLPASS